MKLTLQKVLGCAVTAVLLSSCQKESKAPDEDVNAIPQEVLSKIEAQGFNISDVQKANGGYYVEGDIFLSNEEINNPTQGTDLRVGQEEQYHTKFVIKNLPRVITVSLSGANSPNYSASLDSAVARYNKLAMRLTFQRVAAGGEINIIFSDLGGADPNGGVVLARSAGFPTKQGNPASPITFNSNTAAFGANPEVRYLASIMTHEIGHVIGFRHTDYKNRAYSCGGVKYNEGKAGVGAVHIPGTPAGADPNSWMLACINNSNRPFNANDITALNYLYH